MSLNRRIDTAVSVAALIGMAYLLTGYHKESVLAPSESLPIQDTPDVRRWKHDGSQPITDHSGGNSFHGANWPEVEALL